MKNYEAARSYSHAGWPWWALIPQSILAGMFVFVLIGADSLAQLLFSASTAPENTPDPSEYDSGAMGIVLWPLLLVILYFGPAVFAMLAVTCAVVAGLPIRLNRRVRRWWVANWWLSLVVIGVGLAVAATSLVLYGGRSSASDTIFYWPTSPQFGIALVAVAFGLSHLWLPWRASPKEPK